jgi:hypothetical protein
MKQKVFLVAALAAGFVGGILSCYVSPMPVQAQAQAPKEVRAQNFIVVDDKGKAFGLFGFDPDGKPILKLVDESGKPLWIAPPPPLMK